MAATEYVWMPREVHNYDWGSTYRNDDECYCWNRSIGIVQCYKWGKAGLYIGPHALFQLPISNTRRGCPRLGGWRGVYIQSRQSDDILKGVYFRAKIKTTRILMRELLFADDSALVAHSAEEMQKIVDAFSDASKMFGLKINKTNWGAVPTQLYMNPNGGYHGWWKQAELCSGIIHLLRNHYIK